VTAFTEPISEEAALAWLEALGYAVLHGPDVAADERGAECAAPLYRDVVPKIPIANESRAKVVERQVEKAA
jgi:hypothetical protein